MYWRPFIIATGSAVISLMLVPRASAQSVTVGYQVVRIPDETFPLGFNIDVASPPAGGWSVVGEAGFAHDNSNPPNNTAINFANFGGGVRLGSARSGPGAFVQVIVGGVHASANVTNGLVTTQPSDTAFMLQPGVGIVAPLGGFFAAVVQGDYRRAFFKEGAENEFRGFVGVRLSGR